MDDETLLQKSENNVIVLRNSAKWISVLAAVALGLVYMFWLIWGFKNDAKFIQIMYEHLLAIVGVPGAIISAFVLVNVLEQVSGPVKFSGLGFKFEGASGPLIMWVIVFCSLVVGLKMLW